jgi:tetratricopeptide (TPR) repeat protein
LVLPIDRRDRERLFVAAAEAFFLDPASNDYWLRIRRWEEASEKLYKALPDDPEAATFYALAHLATTPANVITRSHADRAAEILTRVYARNADHPGVMHYLVHANDVQGRERELLDVTRKYDAIAPDNPHALHMPTHIYTRLGDWDAVVRGNQRAAKAALATPAGDSGEYVWDEFPHAVEYLVYAYLQQGADDKAAAEVKRLKDTKGIEPSFKTAFHLASTQARYALERREWNDAASIPLRQPASLDWDRYTWAEAIERFARGLGAAHLGKIPEATSEATRLDALEANTRKAGEDLFARNIQMLNLELHAWIAHAEHRGDSAVALMRAAAELETTTPKHAVTPGPTLPADELLGDLLMEEKRPAEALAAYKKSLELYPRRFNSLLGVARAARAVGDNAAARDAYGKLLEVAGSNAQRPAVTEAKQFLRR